jgi:hypothetical protein
MIRPGCVVIGFSFRGGRFGVVGVIGGRWARAICSRRWVSRGGSAVEGGDVVPGGAVEACGCASLGEPAESLVDEAGEQVDDHEFVAEVEATSLGERCDGVVEHVVAVGVGAGGLVAGSRLFALVRWGGSRSVGVWFGGPVPPSERVCVGARRSGRGWR